jgi:hypothetical protein
LSSPAWIPKATLYQHPLVFCAYEGIAPARDCLLGDCRNCGIHLLIRNGKAMDSVPNLPVTKYVLDRVSWSSSRQWVHTTQRMFGQEVVSELRGNWVKWAKHKCYDTIARAAIQHVKTSLLTDAQYDTAVFIGVTLLTHLQNHKRVGHVLLIG